MAPPHKGSRNGRVKITSRSLSDGILASIMVPFSATGDLLIDHIADQAHLVGSIPGVIGIALNTTARERLCILPEERFEVIRRVREGMNNDQLLFSCVGPLLDVSDDELGVRGQVSV